MKLLMEQWRKLIEGEVIDFPQPPKVSDKDIQRLIVLEDILGKFLEKFYGNQSEIPIEVLERMEELVNSVEESLKK